MSDNSIINIKFSKFTYVLFCLNCYLGNIGYGSVMFSYLIMALVPLCINGAKYSTSLVWLFLILLTYPFINQTIPIFFIYFFVYVFKKIPLNKFASFTLLLYICFFIIQLLLLKLGIVSNETRILLKGNTNSFGFLNSNTFGGFIMGINICIYIINCKNHFWKGIIAILIINQWMVVTSAARTPWIATIVMVLMAVFYKMNIIRNWMRGIFSILPLGFTLLSYYLIIYYYKFPELNFLLSDRLFTLNDILTHSPSFGWITGYTPESPLDCAYLGIVVNGGVLWLFFFLYSTTRCLWFRFREIKVYLPIILMMLISGFTENSFCRYEPYDILFWMIILIAPRNSLGIKSKN